MTNESISNHFRSLNYNVDEIKDCNGAPYIIVRDYTIPTGQLAGRTCDIAIQMSSNVPYVAPSAIHTKPHLVPMDMNRFRTQGSNLGPEWQYWSRVLRDQLHPRNWVTHIATIFIEVNL